MSVLYQHIVIEAGNGGDFDVVVDRDESTRRAFRSYDSALLYAIAILSQSRIQVGEKVHG